jgi:hypothetical protein
MKDESRRLNIMLEQNPVETAIAAIVVDKKLHARWLNTFSYLEYIGFRKIVKSQMAEALTNKVISHALEEGPSFAEANVGRWYGQGLTNLQMTISRNPKSFIRGQRFVLPSNTRGRSRVP